MDQNSKSTIFDYAILDGELLPAEAAQISIFNPALFSSFGVYETVKVDKGRPFYLDEHLHRLHQSAQMIDMMLGAEPKALRSWFYKLMEIDPQATWSLKIIAFGSAEIGSKPIIAMQAIPLPTYPKSLYRTGATAVLYNGQRFMPACKSLNTLVNYLARRSARSIGALEGVLFHDGHLAEGSRSNLFAVRQGQLFTPPTVDVLSGITREVIIDVMRDTDHPVTEAPLPVDLSLYEEVFISSTSMHVMPVTKIGKQPIGNGQVGPITQMAMARFETHYREFIEISQG